MIIVVDLRRKATKTNKQNINPYSVLVQPWKTDFPILIDTMYFKGSHVGFSKLPYDVFLSLNVVLILTNIADPDEMQHYAAFHLGLHCQSPHLGFPVLKGLNTHHMSR